MGGDLILKWRLSTCFKKTGTGGSLFFSLLSGWIKCEIVKPVAADLNFPSLDASFSLLITSWAEKSCVSGKMATWAKKWFWKSSKRLNPQNMYINIANNAYIVEHFSDLIDFAPWVKHKPYSLNIHTIKFDDFYQKTTQSPTLDRMTSLRCLQDANRFDKDGPVPPPTDNLNPDARREFR